MKNLRVFFAVAAIALFTAVGAWFLESRTKQMIWGTDGRYLHEVSTIIRPGHPLAACREFQPDGHVSVCWNENIGAVTQVEASRAWWGDSGEYLRDRPQKDGLLARCIASAPSQWKSDTSEAICGVMLAIRHPILLEHDFPFRRSPLAYCQQWVGGSESTCWTTYKDAEEPPRELEDAPNQLSPHNEAIDLARIARRY